MRYFAFALALLAACSSPEPAPATDTRDPIEVRYVGSPDLPVHKWAREDSPVIAKFLNGESVSVMSRKGDWSEVRTGGGTGWVRSADLAGADHAKKESDEPQPKFRNIPSPVTAPGAKGTVYIEANVNTDGEVVSTKILTNTTGSPELAVKNAAALERAKFHPIVIKGSRKPFLYYYRVDY